MLGSEPGTGTPGLLFSANTGAHRRTGSVLRDARRLSRLPFGGFAGLDNSATPAVCKSAPTGEQPPLKEQLGSSRRSPVNWRRFGRWALQIPGR